MISQKEVDKPGVYYLEIYS